MSGLYYYSQTHCLVLNLLKAWETENLQCMVNSPAELLEDDVEALEWMPHL